MTPTYSGMLKQPDKHKRYSSATSLNPPSAEAQTSRQRALREGRVGARQAFLEERARLAIQVVEFRSMF